MIDETKIEKEASAVKAASHHKITDRRKRPPVTRSKNNTTPAIELEENHDEHDVKVKDDIDSLVSNDPLSTEIQKNGSDTMNNIALLNPVNIKGEIDDFSDDPLTFPQFVIQEADPLSIGEDPCAISDPLAIDFPVLQKSLKTEDLFLWKCNNQL